jgi:hypothetical protein
LWERWKTGLSFSIFSITRFSMAPGPNQALTKQTVAEEVAAATDEGPAFRELPLVSSHRGSEKPVFDKEETNR